MTTDTYAGLVGSTITLDDITIDVTSITNTIVSTSNMSDVYTIANNNTLSCANVTPLGIDMHKNADITVGGKSMREFMEQVNERLAILEPNKKLEAEWAELKELGDQYRAMEQDLLEKAKSWDILKAKNK
tara:strand:- start:67 stop:456 length:390 start_codon:yes stop_codon:yes gene_type:complete